MKILLKNLRLLHPLQALDKTADILIEDGIIRQIGTIKNADSDVKTFEFKGQLCVPGLFDMHVHLREPGQEEKETVETGCNAASNGGFTSIACMPNTSPATDSEEVVNFIKHKSENHLVNVHPIGAVSVGREGQALAPMNEMVDAGAVAFSDDGVAVKNALLLRNAMEYSKMLNSIIIEHCEDESLSDGSMNESLTSTMLGLSPLPTVSEDLIVMRDIMMAEYLDSRVHIAHISSKKSVELVREAKKRGIKVTAEITPHHFTLTDESVKNYDTNYKMNPPLRTIEDVTACIEGLSDGTIDCIATDHAPHTSEEKDKEFIYAPNGIIGLETAVGLTFTELVAKGKLTIEDVIYKLSINPRKILNIEIPAIEEGGKAELSIIDDKEIWTVDSSKFLSKSKNTPFDKRLLTGKPIAVINNKKMFFEGKFIQI